MGGWKVGRLEGVTTSQSSNLPWGTMRRGAEGAMHRGVQFATTEDGVRIAYTVSGGGPPLIWLPHFLASNVQLEWEFPQQYVYNWLGQHLTVVRFDCRGLGLSDREVEDISLEARIRDLRA